MNRHPIQFRRSPAAFIRTRTVLWTVLSCLSRCLGRIGLDRQSGWRGAAVCSVDPGGHPVRGNGLGSTRYRRSANYSALVAGGVFGLPAGAARRMGAIHIFGVAAAAALFANCGTGSAQTAVGRGLPSTDPTRWAFGRWRPRSWRCSWLGLQRPRLLRSARPSSCALAESFPTPALPSRVQLLGWSASSLSFAAFFIAAGQTPERCSLSMVGARPAPAHVRGSRSLRGCPCCTFSPDPASKLCPRPD